MQFLKVANPGVAPVEGFLLLGASTTRDANVSGTTGQFGSGSKHFIRLCLSQGLKPVIYCGNTKLEVFTKDVEVNDGLNTHDFKRICFKVTGQINGKQVNRVEETSITLSYGVHDWTELSMGLREIVSNALDRARREYVALHEKATDAPVDPIGHIKDVTIEVVDSNQVRAKAGETRIFIEYTDEVKQFHAELGKRFLHFSDPNLLTRKILPKQGRNFNGKTPVIYREGVFVREVQSHQTESLYDYNFTADELSIDESRNLDDYQISYAVSKVLRDAEVDVLTEIVRSASQRRPVYENTYANTYYLKNEWGTTDEQKQSRAARWAAAFKAVAGEEGVLCASTITGTLVEAKGYRPTVLSEGPIREALIEHGIATDVKTLSLDPTNGVQFEAVDPSLQGVVDDVWALVELLGKHGGRTKPELRQFVKVMDAERTLAGFCDLSEGFIAINRDLAGGRSRELLKTVLEEVAHHVTKSRDNTRDFQDYLLGLTIDVAAHFGLL